jgi:hypothetical protein
MQLATPGNVAYVGYMTRIPMCRYITTLCYSHVTSDDALRRELNPPYRGIGVHFDVKAGGSLRSS